MTRLTVVLNTRNKLGYLPAVVRALAARVRAAEAPEVVIVDDGSSDGTREYLATAADVRALGAKIIHQDGVGLARARNAGVQVATGDSVLFMDDDIVFGEEFFSALERHLAERPSCVHVGRLRNVGLDAVRALLVQDAASLLDEARLESACTSHAMYDAASVLYAGVNAGECPAIWWAFVTGGNLCVPRAALYEAGGFDVQFSGWGPEDADLCYRLFRRGVSAAFHGECRVYHLDHPRDNKAIAESMMRNMLRFVRRHGAPPELRAYAAFFNGSAGLGDFDRVTAETYDLPAARLSDVRLVMRDVMRRAETGEAVSV